MASQVSTSLADQVFDAILEDILNGNRPAGSHLPSERVLSRELGVSRGVIREPIARLEQVGLVRTRQGGPTEVLDYRRHGGLDLLPAVLQEDIAEATSQLIAFRRTVLPGMASAAAQNADAAAVAVLTAVVDDMESVSETRPLLLPGLVLRFWDTAAALSDNVVFILTNNSLRRAALADPRGFIAGINDEVQNIAGFRALVDAIAAGDAASSAQSASALLLQASDEAQASSRTPSPPRRSVKERESPSLTARRTRSQTLDADGTVVQAGGAL